MIANTVLVFVRNAGKGMFHHRLPGDFTEDLIQVGVWEAWDILQPDRLRNEFGRFAVERGIEHVTLKTFETTAAEQGATKAFLEVAATNTGALALYRAEGWHQTGLRKGYYRSETDRIDAVLMSKPLKPA